MKSVLLHAVEAIELFNGRSLLFQQMKETYRSDTNENYLQISDLTAKFS